LNRFSFIGRTNGEEDEGRFIFLVLFVALQHKAEPLRDLGVALQQYSGRFMNSLPVRRASGTRCLTTTEMPSIRSDVIRLNKKVAGSFDPAE
jgi:hypothetical protein